jgi:hypothetical protein
MPVSKARLLAWHALLAGLVALCALPLLAQDGRLRRYAAPEAGEVEQRFALVVGNRSYPRFGLATPENDARDMATALGNVGFKVSMAIDLDPTRFKAAIRKFEDTLAGADGKKVALVYFAGHGVQLQGRNYLLPAHVEYRDQRDVLDNAIDAEQLLARIQGEGPDLVIMVLDACRDSPLPPIARTQRSGGLARMEAPVGTFLAFATSPGSTASDNSRERNGLFTKYVIQHIQTPGMTAEQVFRRVRTDVYRASRGAQLPEDSNRLVGGDFYFVAPIQAAVVAPEPARPIVASRPPEPVPAKREPAPAQREPVPAKKEPAPAQNDPVPAARTEAPPQVVAAVVPAVDTRERSTAQTTLASALRSGASIGYDVRDRNGTAARRIARIPQPQGFTYSDGSVHVPAGMLESDCCTFDPPLPLLPPKPEVGVRWSYSGRTSNRGSFIPATATSNSTIVAKERLETAAGAFQAYRIEEVRWLGPVRSVHERWVESETAVLLKETITTPTVAGSLISSAAFTPTIRNEVWTIRAIGE